MQEVSVDTTHHMSVGEQLLEIEKNGTETPNLEPSWARQLSPMSQLIILADRVALGEYTTVRDLHLREKVATSF